MFNSSQIVGIHADAHSLYHMVARVDRMLKILAENATSVSRRHSKLSYHNKITSALCPHFLSTELSRPLHSAAIRLALP